MTDFAAARRAMVDTQVRPSDVTRYGIIAAMSEVPRERFVPAARREIAYAEVDVPLAAAARFWRRARLPRCSRPRASATATSCSTSPRAPATRPP
ncbi:MAG: hypothetical protein AAFZ09_02310 [Pseudomonadota bacterium]